MVLGLLFITAPSLADDIRDFQIEGISVGDSFLDYFSTTYTYTTEIPLLDDDQTIYKYKGGIRLGMKKLDIKIDANRGAVTDMLLKKLKFGFNCLG